MILSGWNFGGVEIETLKYTLEWDNYSVEGWLYNNDGNFNWMA
jgi:hypothetical protein